MEETGVPGENHRPAEMLHQVHPAWVGFELINLVVLGTDCIDFFCRSHYHTTTTAPHDYKQSNLLGSKNHELSGDFFILFCFVLFVFCFLFLFLFFVVFCCCLCLFWFLLLLLLKNLGFVFKLTRLECTWCTCNLNLISRLAPSPLQRCRKKGRIK